MNLFVKTYKYFGKLYRKLKFYSTINWIKTFYFNFKMLPYEVAIKLPIYFYGAVKFSSLKGKITINGEINPGMIGFGQSYEIITKSKKNAEVFIDGDLTFNGHVQFGKDYFLYIAKNGVCQMGNMSSLGNSGKIMCFQEITLGDYCRLGFESQIIDTNSHVMIDTITGESFPKTGCINLGNYNYFGNRITILKDTKTPNFCTIASNSLCNNDYLKHGENCIIGGVPSKLLKENITRDWFGEMNDLTRMLTTHF